jgi:hypothetical protein
MKISQSRFTSSAFLCLSMLGAANAVANQNKNYTFDVYLDGKAIGKHQVSIENKGKTDIITTSADFNVKLLFVDVYQYRHNNREIWKGQCLQAIDASTDANGTDYFIRGTGSSQGMSLETHDGKQQVKGCVRTFAYWNPVLLKADKLLNTQTAEYVNSTLENLGDTELSMQSRKRIPATRFKLVAGKDEINLWYTSGHDWLALESKTRDGKIIRYERIQGPAYVSARL